MNASQVIRAWKNKAYRNSLSADERAQLPAHPAGRIELDEIELAEVGGGMMKPTRKSECTWDHDCFTGPSY